MLPNDNILPPSGIKKKNVEKVIQRGKKKKNYNTETENIWKLIKQKLIKNGQ